MYIKTFRKPSKFVSLSSLTYGYKNIFLLSYHLSLSIYRSTSLSFILKTDIDKKRIDFCYS